MSNDREVGSSPHTRGTRWRLSDEAGAFRFIPAYAGNAALHIVCVLPLAVHPRIRGERLDEARQLEPVIGSSPHTRGTPEFLRHAQAIQRFIPAYAGNAWVAPTHCSDRSVHPRIRGERTSNKLLIYQGKIAPSDSTKHSAC